MWKLISVHTTLMVAPLPWWIEGLWQLENVDKVPE